MVKAFKRRAGGRIPAQETDAARLLIDVFGSFRQAGEMLGVSRQAVQTWAAAGEIPESRLDEMQQHYREAVIAAQKVGVFNKLGRQFAITIHTHGRL